MSTETKKQFLQNRLKDTVLLATEKAAAHILNPSAFPLPPSGTKSLERAFYDVAMALPKRKRDDFAEKLKAAVHTSDAGRRQKYGDLHAVNLKSNIPVHEQVKNIAVPEKMKFTKEDLEKHDFGKQAGKAVLSKHPAAPRQAALASKVDFIVDSLTCNKTNDLRKDEINIAAFASDNQGNSFDKAPFLVGEFKKGDTLPLNAAGNLFSFPVDGGSTGEFPIVLSAGIFIVETDIIHNTDLGEKLATAFSVAQVLLLTTGMGLMFVPGISFPLVFGLLVASVACGLLGHYVFPSLTDDIGAAVTDTLSFEAQPGIGETVSKNLPLEIDISFFGIKKGDYSAAIRWVTS